MIGDTAAQQAIQKLIEAYPEIVAAVKTVVRNAAATRVGALGWDE
jgi:hypothetical protein